MMDWSDATWWWLAAGGLVAAELLTGTFYLLMLALGAAAGALAAHAGAAATAQVALAALAGGGGVGLWHMLRARRKQATPATPDALQLDVGCRVQVARWQADGTARVQHRGAEWAARYAGPGQAHPGPHVIKAVQANELLLERAASA